MHNNCVCFTDGICWTRTAERQTSRMRVEYLRSVLSQEVGFFDEHAGSSTTFDVISSISADAYSIQNVIAEKVKKQGLNILPRVQEIITIKL